MTDEIIIEDYAEPLTLHRFWYITQAIVWAPKLEPKVLGSGESFVTAQNAVGATIEIKYPDVNLFSMNGTAWTPHNFMEASCQKQKNRMRSHHWGDEVELWHQAPDGNCVCGIYGRTDFPEELWRGLLTSCGYAILKFKKLMLCNSETRAEEIFMTLLASQWGNFVTVDFASIGQFLWPVKGEMQLWGKLRKGTGQDKHPQGFRGQFARPKKLILSPVVKKMFGTGSYLSSSSTLTPIAFFLNDIEKIADRLRNHYDCEVELENYGEGYYLVGGPHTGKFVSCSYPRPSKHYEPKTPNYHQFVIAARKVDYDMYCCYDNSKFFIHESLIAQHRNGEMLWTGMHPYQSTYDYEKRLWEGLKVLDKAKKNYKCA